MLSASVNNLLDKKTRVQLKNRKVYCVPCNVYIQITEEHLFIRPLIHACCHLCFGIWQRNHLKFCLLQKSHILTSFCFFHFHAILCSCTIRFNISTGTEGLHTLSFYYLPPVRLCFLSLSVDRTCICILRCAYAIKNSWVQTDYSHRIQEDFGSDRHSQPRGPRRFVHRRHLLIRDETQIGNSGFRVRSTVSG